MKLPLPLLLVVLVSPIIAEAQIAGDFEKRVGVSVVRNRKVRIGGGDWDDKNDTVSFTVKFTNRAGAKAYTGGKVDFFVIGKSVVDTASYKLLSKESFPMELPAPGEFNQQTTPVTTKWDNTDAKFGVRYDSWAMIVRGSAGEVLLKKSSSPTWQTLIEKLAELPTGESFDRQLRKRQIIGQ
jgi:hypothetical protein